MKKRFSFSRIIPWNCVLLFLVLTGCGEPEMGKVTGKVTYSDGSIPQGGIAVIRFEVAEDSQAKTRKAADSDIAGDGSFDISTMKPGDGAFLGKYKVVFTICKSYRDRSTLVDEKYTSAKTTPYECTVDSAEKSIDFVIEPAK